MNLVKDDSVKRKKGTIFISMELILVFGFVLAFGAIIISFMMPKQEMINTAQYEGLILSKHDAVEGKQHRYYIDVQGVKGEPITFSIESKNYYALEAGYQIKYFSYQQKDDESTYYELGTKDSVGTVILIANSNAKESEK